MNVSEGMGILWSHIMAGIYLASLKTFSGWSCFLTLILKLFSLFQFILIWMHLIKSIWCNAELLLGATARFYVKQAMSEEITNPLKHNSRRHKTIKMKHSHDKYLLYVGKFDNLILFTTYGVHICACWMLYIVKHCGVIGTATILIHRHPYFWGLIVKNLNLRIPLARV